jgi:hypothetical protein
MKPADGRAPLKATSAGGTSHERSCKAKLLAMYIPQALRARNPMRTCGWEGLNVSKLALRLGWPRDRTANILTGRVQSVRLIELVRLAEELRMDREELLAMIDSARILDRERELLQARMLLAGVRTAYGRLVKPASPANP